MMQQHGTMPLLIAVFLKLKWVFKYRSGSKWVVSIWLMSSRRLQCVCVDRERERESPAAHMRVSVCSVLLTVCLQPVCFPMGKYGSSELLPWPWRGAGEQHINLDRCSGSYPDTPLPAIILPPRVQTQWRWTVQGTSTTEKCSVFTCVQHYEAQHNV